MARIVMNMDRDWRFFLGDVTVEASNRHSASYTACKAGNVGGPGGKQWNDRDWRVLDLPHDYFAESGFSPDNLISHGYRTRENAWYRKSFLLDASLSDKELFLCFEGTAVNAEFYFNGSLMARSFSAYTETVFNITDRAYFDGRPNVLAVHIKGTETEGWWYEGAGIYRHVKLYVKNCLHIAHNGVFGKPVLREGTKNSWRVDVEAAVENSAYADENAVVRATVLDGERIVRQGVTKPLFCARASETVAKLSLPVSRPVRWDVDNPKLYTLKVELLKDGEVVDEESVRIGFRTFFVDAARGFFLNDRPVKIKGTCNHQDHAGVGVALPDSVQYYRIKRLKEMGSNAYRASHNLPTKEVLDVCDELGLIVMDENRRFESRDEVLSYLEIMVKRDRNHPSVIFWSLFNEEPLQNTEEGAKIYRRMRSVVERLDDSRFITGAINGSMEGAGLEMDITGINYFLSSVPSYHEKHPTQPIIGSENNSAVTTRGCYATDKEGAQVLSNYDEEAVPWGHTIRDNWRFTRSHDYYAGIFVWTGFDYRGEPTPFGWPSVSSQFGIMDTCGFAKDAFYFHQACFTEKPMVHLLPHWNHKKGDVVRVMAVSNCDEVELFVNGVSQGRKKNDICDATPEWQVPFTPGRITAKAYRGGRCVAKAEQRTAGKPYAIKITSDRPTVKNDGHDTAILNVCVVDRRGVVVPTASNLIRFEVLGDGFVRGVGNGDPNSHEPDFADYRHAFAGWCQALVTPHTGAKSIAVRAYAEGLLEDVLTLAIEPVPAPVCPESAVGYPLDGFTASAVTSGRPDPLVVIADNDMNSFMPIRFAQVVHQGDFLDGWRIYRVTPRIFADAAYVVTFEDVAFRYAEVYVNGELLDKQDAPRRGLYELPPFLAKAGEVVDLRILMRAEHEDENDGAGIAKNVILQER
ncbi:MAG: DUF4982 domain-containing protein [Clostridia bacterium]|nr:DUF4982 domain-containing protein [Clostridia bacterium]